MKFVVDLLFGIIFAVSLAGLGVFAFNKILKVKLDFISGFFAGCGTAIIILFISGLLGIFSKIFFIIFIIVIFLFSIAGRRALFRLRLPLKMVYVAPLLLLAAVLLLAALSSLSPPLKNDTLYYHLGLPRLWGLDGGIEFYPWLSFSATALNSELLLTPIVSFVSPEAAQFFVFIIALMIFFALGKGAFEHLDIAPAAAIVVLGSVSFFVTGMSDAKNDYLAAGFALISFFFYADYLRSKEMKFIMLAGAFAGLAASTKTNSLIFAVAMLIMLLIVKPRLKEIIWFIIPCVVLGSPWYIRALVETANPFYPFFNGIFHSPLWREVFDAFNRATGVRSEHRTLINFLTSPVRLIYFPDIFRARIGPLPLILMPILFLIKGVPSLLKKALLVSLIFYVLWYIAWPNARYLMPVVVLLCLPAAYVFDWLMKNARVAGVIALVGISALIALSGVQVYRDGKLRMEAALGIVGKDAFLRTATVLDPNRPAESARLPAVPYYDIWQYLNVASEPDAVVAILCSDWYRADGFYLDRHFIYLNPTDQTVVDFTGNRMEMSQAIVKENIRYVLIDRDVIKEFSPDSELSDAPGFAVISRGVRDFVDIIKQNGRLVYITDRFELYRIKNLSAISAEPFS